MMNIYEESTLSFWICKTDRHNITEKLLKVGEETGVPGKSHRAVASTPRNEGNSKSQDQW